MGSWIFFRAGDKKVLYIIDLASARMDFMVKKICFDNTICLSSLLREEKITEEDLPLIQQYVLRDWEYVEYDREMLIKYSRWVVNEDKSIILKAAGGGCFEHPLVYELVYKGSRTRLQCGGGGWPTKEYLKHDDGTYDITVFVSHIDLPGELRDELDTVMAVAGEALAVEAFSFQIIGRLTVEFPG